MPNFNANAVERIGKRVRAGERSPSAPAIGDRRIPKPPQVRPGRVGVITTAVSARAGVSPTFTLGTGAATMYFLDDAGVTSLDAEGVAVRNTTNVVIPVGPDLCQFLWVDGHWLVTVAGCET